MKKLVEYVENCQFKSEFQEISFIFSQIKNFSINNNR